MPNFNKVLASTGLSRKNNRLNLGGFQVNSLDFCRYKLLGAYDMQPSDKYSIDFSHVLKMTPLVGHTLGKCQLDAKAMFVPYRLAYKYFEEFQRGVSVVADTTFNPVLPKVKNSDLTMYFSYFPRCGWKVTRNNYNDDGSPWTSQSDFTYVNSFVDNFDPDKCLCEIVGVCAGIDHASGKPMGVIRFDTKGFQGNFEGYSMDGIYPIGAVGDAFNFAIDEGEDYDFVAPFYSIVNDDLGNDDAFAISFYPFQAIGINLADSNGNFVGLSGQNRPYALLRFTPLGKRLFDFFNTLGYGLSFGSPVYNSPLVSDQQDAFPVAKTDDAGMAGQTCEIFYTHFVEDQQCDGDPQHWYGAEPDTVGYLEGSFLMIGEGFHSASESYYSFLHQGSGFDQTPLNILKVLAWFKVYSDYLCPSYWVRDFEVEVNSYFFGKFSLDGLFDLLSRTLISSYDKDYFTSAWLTPNQPTEQSFNKTISSTDAQIPNVDPDHYDNEVESSSTGTVLNGDVSKTTLDIVQALHKLARITGLSGTRYIDQLFARFGVKNTNSRLQRSEKLGEMRSSFDVETVMSNASTNDASLGDYTAHGHSENSGHLGHGEITEFGVILVFADITPFACYYQGRVRQNIYQLKDDFYSPELDEVDATQSIRMDEIFSDNRIGPLMYNAQNDDVYRPDGTFGYTRLFGETKHGRDYIGGDFRLASRGKYTNQAYHLFRDMPSLSTLINNALPLTNSLNFNLTHDSTQYDRIFQLMDGDYDHFYVFANLDVNVTRKNKPINDFSYEDECEKIKRSLHNGGTELN